MALSFGRALLAGAAGVAEYSNEKQRERQRKLDRAMELAQRFQLEQAKSEYAMKYQRWEKDDDIRRTLGTTDPKSAAGQFIIQSKMNPKMQPDDVARLISAPGYKPLGSPVDTGVPLFRMPDMMGEYTASSPIEDWVRGFTGNSKPISRQEGKTFQELFQIPSAPTVSDMPQQPQTGAGELTPAGGQGMEQLPSTDGAVTDIPQEPQVTPEPTGFQEQAQTFAKSFETPAKPLKPEVTKQDTIRNGKKGKIVSFTDPTTLQTKSIFIGTDLSGMQRIDPVIQEASNGQKVMTERLYDPTNDEIIMGDQYMTKTADPEEPVEPVKLTNLKEYLRKGDDDNPPGQFYADFPEAERDRWRKMDTEAWFGWSSDAPEGFQESIAGAYMDAKNASVQKLKGKHVSNPQFMSEMKDVWKATAYVQVMGVDGIISAIKEGALEPDQFYGRRLNRLPVVQQIQKKLGITRLEDPEKFEEYSLPKYQF